MEFNRLISLVIGFIVLILVFVWIGSRFRSATKTEANKNITITLTPTITPTKGASQGWNPFAFLFNRNNTPTPTPSQTIAKKTTKISPTTILEGESEIIVQRGEQTIQQTQDQGETVVVYKNNRTGKAVTITDGATTTKGGIKQIPETGVPTIVLPIAFSALTLGAYLRKRS